MVFFGFLWYFWFSRRIFWFCKNLRENQKNKKQNISKGESETFKNFVFVGFPEGCFGVLWFSLVFLGFLEGFFLFLFKPSGKPKKTKNKPMGSFQISEISEISEKYHAFEIWCLECSSLGPTAKISIHLSNSVWLVCVGFCMVLHKFSRFACTP